MNDAKELHYRYNFFYLTAILIVVIIALITTHWGSIEGLVDYISFGLTLTSLFLALIAIIYAIISNTTFAQHLGTLRGVTQNVNDASSNLTQTSKNLESSLSEIPALIRIVEGKIDETHRDIKEKLVDKSKEAPRDENRTPVVKGLDPDKFLADFLKSSSFNGLAAIYTAQCAFSSKKPFDITKVWATTSLDFNYGYAYLVACSAMGLIGHNHKENMWSITFIADTMPNLRDNLVAWLQTRADDEPEKWNVDSEIQTSIVPIENYFKD